MPAAGTGGADGAARAPDDGVASFFDEAGVSGTAVEALVRTFLARHTGPDGAGAGDGGRAGGGSPAAAAR